MITTHPYDGIERGARYFINSSIMNQYDFVLDLVQ